MNTFRVLASPRVWGPVLGVVTVLALIFYAYLAAVASPQENLKDLPIALVNEDRGADFAGEKVNLGDRIIEKVTDPDAPAAGTVDWIRPDTRENALRGIGNDEFYGAIVIPRDYTQRISDPVKGIVSEADVSSKAGPLPKAPEPAEIEVLTNPSAGQAVAAPVQNISTGIVDAVSGATSGRIAEQAGERGAQLPPEVATVIGDPVRADVTEAEPVGPDSGNGQSPFFLSFLANLSGLVGGAVVFFLIRDAAERLEARGTHPSSTGLWTVRLLLALVYAALVAGAELWVAFGLLGVEHEADTMQVYLFLSLAIAAVASITMLFAVIFGPAGIGISAVLNVILGLVSSGGAVPLEALPPFYQAYADWLPIRYVIDGLRSLLFYNGTLDAASLEGGWRDSLWFLGGDGRSEAAGLEDAVWMIGAYLAGTVALGFVISLVRDLATRRGRREIRNPPEGAEAAG
jgi:YhgE/Pip-like protein